MVVVADAREQLPRAAYAPLPAVACTERQCMLRWPGLRNSTPHTSHAMFIVACCVVGVDGATRAVGAVPTSVDSTVCQKRDELRCGADTDADTDADADADAADDDGVAAGVAAEAAESECGEDVGVVRTAYAA
eukprot:gb/GEZJ01005540.1/.p2 GENE.gb/GEZJ01005540.1/~~gb/GEZJ01005540.1/.p2  ORF type:complete len:149 (-),score=28.92 gb/GEZJ01005540.1/:165-563(-)